MAAADVRSRQSSCPHLVALLVSHHLALLHLAHPRLREVGLSQQAQQLQKLRRSPCSYLVLLEGDQRLAASNEIEQLLDVPLIYVSSQVLRQQSLRGLVDRFHQLHKRRQRSRRLHKVIKQECDGSGRVGRTVASV